MHQGLSVLEKTHQMPYLFCNDDIAIPNMDVQLILISSFQVKGPFEKGPAYGPGHSDDIIE